MRYLLLAALLSLFAAPACARAGGGGYSSGGGGGYSSGGYSSGGYSSGDYSSGVYSSRGYYRRSRYNRPMKEQLIELGIFLAVIAGFGLFKKKTEEIMYASPAEKPLPRQTLQKRAEQTAAILKDLSRGDPSLDPRALASAVKRSFLDVQAAWQARDYTPLQFRMMPQFYASQTAKTDGLLARGHVNMMEDVVVQSVDFVHVRYPEDPAARGFTALISATARDYTVDQNTRSVISGSKSPRPFQEFWTFQQYNGSWVPARIDQADDDYILTAPNLPEAPGGGFPASAGPAAAAAVGFPPQTPLSAQGAALAGGFAAQFQPPPAPPAAPRARAPELDRWDRQKMQIAATLAFESVYAAWGKNDAALLSPDFVSAEALAKLKTVMLARAAEGLAFEFNSLFVRRAEIVLTSPARKDGTNLDEFTARITGSAARALLRNGKPLHREAAPEPFTEYWVFGRQADSWKLRDILPRMDQAGENAAADGAPGPAQIEWYWEV